MLEQHPSFSQNRPQSAMDSNTYYLPTRRMPTPNGPCTTSVKSVFDCELGCFIEDHNAETPTEIHSSPISQTSDPKDV